MKNFCRLICLLICMAASMSWGQVTTAVISGVVQDPTGAVVPNATITLINTATSTPRTATTDTRGRFTFEFVLVGNYTISAKAASFKPAQTAEFPVVAGQQVDIPIEIALANVVESVSVTADTTTAITLDTTQSVVIAQVSSTQLNQLPTAHQDWSSLLTLTAAATKQTGANSTDTAGTPGGVSINGLPSVGYNLTVDGTNASTNTEFSSYAAYQAPNIINTVSNDAISGVEISKGVIPASVSDAVSGNINIVTRNGGNKFHGSTYEINEESYYDARNQFATFRPRTTFNEYGGFFGGPIRRDHLFFFGSYEGAHYRTSKAVSGNVPTPYLESISPSVYKTIFSLFPAIAQPSGSATATSGLYTGLGSFRQDDGNGVARIDYSLNPNNQIFVRYIRARPFQLAPALIPTNQQTTISHTDAVNATYTHLGTRWAENTRFGYNRVLYTRVQNGYYSQLPNVSFGWTTNGSNAPNAFLSHGYFMTLEEGIAGIIGKHNIQFGGIFQKTNSSRYKLNCWQFSYSSLSAFLADAPTTVTLGLYKNPSGAQDLGYTEYQYGGYAEDDWRLTEQLTLNLGVRYDYFTIPQEYQGRVFNRGVDPANPQLGAGFGPYRPANSMYNADGNNVQPRVGFNWNPAKAGTTVVRGAFGMMVANNTLFAGPVGVENFSSQLPFTLSLSASQTSASGIVYPYDATQYSQAITSLINAGIISVNLVNIAIPANHPDPYSMQYTLGVQQMLPAKLSLQVDYIGNHALKLIQYENNNQPNRITGIQPVPTFSTFYSFPDGDRSMYNGLQTNLARKTASYTIQGNYTWGKVLSYGDGDLLQPTPPQDNGNMKAEHGPSPFDMRHRFVANGLWTLPIGAWSGLHGPIARRLLDGWQISGIFTAQTGQPVNLVNTTSSAYPADRPDRQSGPLYMSGYRKRNSIGVHQYLNPCIGSALTPTVAASSSACSVNAVSPAFSLVSASSKGVQVRGGTLGRYALTGPGYMDLDASIAKTIPLREGMDIQLRMDTFNTLNHTNYGGIINTINTPATFGEASSATPRTVQLGGRFTF